MVQPIHRPPLGYGGGFTDAQLRRVAIRQKVIILCFLLEIIAMVWVMLEPSRHAIPASLKVFYGAAVICSLIFVFLLCLAVGQGVRGAVYAILSIVPVVGLIVLLVVNKKAIRILSDHRIPVGFLGVPMMWIIKTR